MKNINFRALGLAILVILMFIGVGIFIASHNILAMIICLLLGCGLMGYGITLKKQQQHSDS